MTASKTASDLLSSYNVSKYISDHGKQELDIATAINADIITKIEIIRKQQEIINAPLDPRIWREKLNEAVETANKMVGMIDAMLEAIRRHVQDAHKKKDAKNAANQSKGKGTARQRKNLRRTRKNRR